MLLKCARVHHVLTQTCRLQIDEWAPIRNEVQVRAPAGSVFMQDTRNCALTLAPMRLGTLTAGARPGHSVPINLSSKPRVACVCRYTGWWLHTGYGPPMGDANSCEWIPRSVATTWPEAE